NITLGLRQRFNTSKSDKYTNKFQSVNPYAQLHYDFLNGFIFKADYHYTYKKNISNNQSNRFQLGNVSLFYSKEGSAWGFEVEVNNLYDLQYKLSHNFNQFMVYDQKVFIQPRTILFILSYQL